MSSRKRNDLALGISHTEAVLASPRHRVPPPPAPVSTLLVNWRTAETWEQGLVSEARQAERRAMLASLAGLLS
jgi:hypothetical protein